MPVSSPIAWPGGKRLLLQTLLGLVPEHAIYVEPFCGSAKLLFAKEPSRYEVMSDANSDLINFYLTLKYRTSALCERLHNAIAHPHWFDVMKGPVGQAAQDEVERAFQFLYLNVLSFAGMGETYGYSFQEPKPIQNLRRLADLLPMVSQRLVSVVIEKSNYAEVIRRYDSARTFFYLDPPYVEFSANARYEGFGPEQLDKLFLLLHRMKGQFLMSEEDHKEVRRRVKRYDFRMRQVTTTYTTGKGNPQKVYELLISNYVTPAGRDRWGAKIG